MINTAKKSCNKDKKMDCLINAQSLGISKNSSKAVTPQVIRDWLMSSRQDFLVSPSASQGQGKEPMTQKICGHKQSKSSGPLSRNMSFLRTYLDSYRPTVGDAYAAGLMDGDGCITIGRDLRKKHYYLRVEIGMTKAINLLQILKNTYGGNFTRMRKESKKWAEAHTWRIFSDNAMTFLKRIYPYLILKRQQATIGIALQELINNAPRHLNKTARWSEDLQEKARKLKQEMHRLNKKGPKKMPPHWFAKLVDDQWIIPQRSLFDTSDVFSQTWPKQGIMLRGKCWELQMSELRIKEKGCGFWPMPTRQDSKNNGGASQYKKNSVSLNAIVRKFPTPQASMMTEADMEQAKFAGNNPDRPKYCDAGGGCLNPDWVEWLMGWIPGLTSLEPASRGENLWAGLWQLAFVEQELGWWDIDPADAGDIPRTTTKTKDRVNRLKAIGNGQVPLCMARAWGDLCKIIKKYLDNKL